MTCYWPTNQKIGCKLFSVLKQLKFIWCIDYDIMHTISLVTLLLVKGHGKRWPEDILNGLNPFTSEKNRTKKELIKTCIHYVWNLRMSLKRLYWKILAKLNYSEDIWKKAKVWISIRIWLCVNFYTEVYILSHKNDNSFRQTLRKERISSNCDKITLV